MRDYVAIVQSALETRRKVLTLTIFILILSFILRIRWISALPFTEKDLYHFYVGQSIFTEGTLQLPSGRTYPRGILQSVIVGLSVLFFGPTRWAARFPSVIFGTLTAAVITWNLIDTEDWPTGLSAGLLIATSPLLIGISTTARTYALAILIHVSMAVLSTYLVTLEEPPVRPLVGLTVLVVSGVILAALVHRFVFLSALCTVGVLAMKTASEYSLSELKEEVIYYRLPFIASIGIIASIIIVSPINLLSPVSIVPAEIEWFYTREMMSRYGVLIPFAAFGLILAVGRAGLMKIVNNQTIHGVYFIAPLIGMEIFLTQFTHEKYLTVLLPSLFVISMLGARDLVGGFRKHVFDRDAEGVSPALVALMMILTVVSAPVATTGEIATDPDNMPLMSQTALEEAHDYLAGQASDEDIIISYYPESTLASTGDVDYYIRQRSYEQFNGEEPISGAPILKTREQVEAVLEQAPVGTDVWVVYDKRYVRSGYMSSETVVLLEEQDSEINQFNSDGSGWSAEIVVMKIRHSE